MRCRAPAKTPISADQTGAASRTSRGCVDDVFQSVARRYDLMNDLMSGGLHRAWKDALVTAVNPPPKATRNLRVLDLAGGTGDVAFRGLRRRGGAGTRATVVRHQCRHARRRVTNARAERGSTALSRFEQGNAEELPYPDRSFDCVTIAFGIRNVPRIERALARSSSRAASRRAVSVSGIFRRSTCRASTRFTSFIRSR